MNDSRMHGYWPLLVVCDVQATIDFYRSRLGFEHVDPKQASELLEGDFAMLRRDDVVLMFKAVPGGRPRPNHTVHEWSGHDAFIAVKDLEPLCEELRSKGVTIIREIEETEWGTREFHFADNNGYVFCCGHSLERMR